MAAAAAAAPAPAAATTATTADAAAATAHTPAAGAAFGIPWAPVPAADAAVHAFSVRDDRLVRAHASAAEAAIEGHIQVVALCKRHRCAPPGGSLPRWLRRRLGGCLVITLLDRVVVRRVVLSRGLGARQRDDLAAWLALLLRLLLDHHRRPPRGNRAAVSPLVIFVPQLGQCHVAGVDYTALERLAEALVLLLAEALVALLIGCALGCALGLLLGVLRRRLLLGVLLLRWRRLRLRGGVELLHNSGVQGLLELLHEVLRLLMIHARQRPSERGQHLFAQLANAALELYCVLLQPHAQLVCCVDEWQLARGLRHDDDTALFAEHRRDQRREPRGRRLVGCVQQLHI